MAKTTSKARVIPVLTDWSEAVDSVNYAKGTNIQVVKDGGKNHATGNTYAHNQGAQPLFKYKNAKGNIGDWYAIDDVTEVTKIVKSKEGKVTTTQKGFTNAQMAKIQALMQAGLL
jgi:hypothetical protein